MGACCGSSKVGEENEKCEKGGDTDISGGPRVDRGCTDITCLLIYLLHWLVFGGVTFMGVADGDPSKLYKPRDFRGDYCGVEKQWNDGLNLKSQEQLTFTMNVTETVELIAKELVCSTVAQQELAALMTVDQMDTYRCACCLDACDSCMGSLKLGDYSSSAALSASMSGKMGELTGSSSASGLYSAGGFNGDMISNVWKEATRYFNMVCLEKCATPYTNISKIIPARSYTYSPAPDVAWKKAWDVLSTNTNVAAAIRTTIQTKFTFTALPKSMCPYEDRYCVPFPGVTFKEISNNYCTFEMAAEVMASIGSSAAGAYEQLGANNLAEGMGNSLGDAVGDFMKSIDVFIITSFLSLVIGLIFLILLRFVVGCIVWGSIFAVFVAFLAGGGFLFVRSSQCAGAGLLSSGQAVGNAAVTSAATSASNQISGDETADESMTGDGSDYRGVQTHTQSGKSCQSWNATSPHNHGSTPGKYPTAGLTLNYCRNPESAPTIWCYTTDPKVRWELCSPIGVLSPMCPQGYAVTSEHIRVALEYFAYALWIVSFLWIILVCCLNKQIRLAISLNKVAAMFVYNTPTSLFVPIVQIFVGVCWCLAWALSASFLLSQVPADYMSTSSYASYAEAYGTVDTPGACTDKYPVGTTWKYEGDLLSTSDLCSGNLGDTSGIVSKCWKCAPPRYIIDWRVGISFFSYLWNAAFLIAIGQCTIAGAVAVWFFAPLETKRQVSSVRTGLRNVFRYHMGSLALGSFILAVVQFIKYFCKYLEKQAAAQKNRVMVMVFKVLQCCLWCIEKCVKFLNKNAYIQIAIMGNNFCSSARQAFHLMLRNFARFGVMATLGSIIHFLGMIFITVATTVSGYFVLTALHGTVSPVVPMLAYLMVGYLVAALFMNVFGLATDTLLHCFIATEEMGGEGEVSFVPGPMKEFVKSCGSGVDAEKMKQDAQQLKGVVPGG